MDIQPLIDRIARLGAGLDHVVIALSGGVDSGLVAYAAYRAIGPKAVAVTVRSELTLRRDFTRAVEVAEHIGVEHHPLPLRLLDDTLLRRNNADRCYHCKKQILRMMMSEYGDSSLIVDGTNADDDPARPGLRAVQELGVRSPLAEAGLHKQQVRALAREAGLPNWDAPSESCLATRIPAGIPLSSRGLERVQAMESFFHDRGVETLRASHDNLVATVRHLSQYTEIINKNRDNFAALVEQIGLRSFIFEEWNE